MKEILDGCQATAKIAYKCSQIIPIYPITPSTPMSEMATSMQKHKQKNVFGQDVKVIEMQSEGGVSGTLHGAILGKALSTTFTSSQGLLLMLPNLYKLAGENLPAVIHVSARAVSSHALSIFCDHSDVMAVRSSGVIILASDSVQSSHDMAMASHMLALKSSLPVLHFIDGFRTSHEIQKIETFNDKQIKDFIDKDYNLFKNKNIQYQYGTAQNPDTFFQNRIACDSLYKNVEKNIKEIFDLIYKESGRKYQAFDFYGDKNAEKIIVAMGSSCQTIEEYIDNNKTEKIGLIKVNLYRPFLKDLFIQALPKSTKIITVLDRTKENGSTPPLALDVISSLVENKINIKVLSGIYGLGGKEFTPDCVCSIFENMENKQKNNFTVNIIDDVNDSSLELRKAKYNEHSMSIKIFGLGSDGSVSASKSTIKILGVNFNKYVQGYFEYDSKKSGSLTQSHIRISDKPIKSQYLLDSANIISINNFSFVHRYDCLKNICDNGIVLLNSMFTSSQLNKVLPNTFVEKLKEKNCNLYIIDAQKIALQCGLGNKINIIMQTALLFAGKLLDKSQIIKNIENEIIKNYSIKGQEIVNKNINALKSTFENIEKVDYSTFNGVRQNNVRSIDDDFYKKVVSKLEALAGDSIPVSGFSSDGKAPLGTRKFETKNMPLNIPKFIKENCIQCGMCTLACPHSALSSVLIEENEIPENQKDDFAKALGFENMLYKILLNLDNCTGCGICANTCPALKKALTMVETEKYKEKANSQFEKYKLLKNAKQNKFSKEFAKGLQFEKSLFKAPSACSGCGQTAYIKILTMLNGSNMMIANATGCSSIYSGSYGSCPFELDEQNKGITWANSLFEDNAEFGLGMTLAKEYTENGNKKIWIIGGDGWAYDIGYGGLDHVLASGENVNILVLDNQSYSNTGGQTSKATPLGASIKFSENGKTTLKKNLGFMALNYKNVFVAQVAMGKDINQTIKALKDAQDYDGPSIVIAYCPCINQGFDLSNSMQQQKEAVDCGFWPLYTYNPQNKVLKLQSAITNNGYFDFLKKERRFKLTIENGKEILLKKQRQQANEEFEILKNKSEKNVPN